MQEKKNRLKTNFVWIIVSAVIMLVGVPLFFVQPIVAFFVFATGLGSFIGFLVQRKRIKRCYCPACSTRFDFEKDVKWKEINRSSVVTGKEKRIKARVKFICTCPECQKKTEFAVTFTVSRLTDAGAFSRDDLDELARKYFS
jgi:hypothetical protein